MIYRKSLRIVLGSALAFVAIGAWGRAEVNTEHSVIVLMKKPVTGADAADDQAPLVKELQQRNNSRRIKAFRLLNAFATKVSSDELARLRANPTVAQVVPDLVVRPAPSATAPQAPAAAPAPAPGSSLPLNDIPGACGANGQVLLDPEALEVTSTNSDNPKQPTARSLGLTGDGVKVAWIADGIDPNNVNFLRADGHSAFANPDGTLDYHDFSGDPSDTPTDGAEAFLDANAIAGQGLHPYDVSGFSAQPTSTACKVRVEGMAPGVHLVGFKVFSQTNVTTQSGFLQAIEYAVTVAKVDVLNESFGSNFFPDVTSQDILKQFNDAAVHAGVTVTVSSGDSGTTNTIGTPATDPLVIAVGGSTTFRFYAQTNYANVRYFATTGWLNDNITSLSSTGYTQDAQTLDIVAPGDLGFASCDASANFSGCTDLQNKPAEVQRSGGTSMASPLTAGAAALVIQAYRLAHRGLSPSPATVKQILLSTATDLGVPANEQGAGLVNSYKAVLLAQRIHGGSVTLAAKAPVDTNQGGLPLLISHGLLQAEGPTGMPADWPVTITNPTSVGQRIQLSGRTFGPFENTQQGTVVLNDASSLKFSDFSGPQDNYATFTFTVPPVGADRLTASLSYPGDPTRGNNARVRMILIDSKGRLAAHSLPQGVGNFGNVDVRNPAPGTWTGVIFSEVTSAKGTVGNMAWQVSTQAFVPFGTVTPTNLYLGPKQHRTVHFAAATPSTPGDATGLLVVSSSLGGSDANVGAVSNSIPVILRSDLDLAHGGNFSGTMTGGNGREGGIGQVQYYQFEVGPGHSSLLAYVSLTNDAADAVGVYLISPYGVAMGYGQNIVDTGVKGSSPQNALSATASTLDPAPGKWTLIVDFAGTVVGNEISQAYSGNVQLDGGVNATAPALPNDAATELAVGTPLNVPVTVTNHGAAPAVVFIDARLSHSTPVQLAALGLPATGFSGYVIPMSLISVQPLWIVPSHTSMLEAHATGSVPFEFDYSPAPGNDPDLFGAPEGETNGTYAAGGIYAPPGGTVSAGNWTAAPIGIGPFPASGEPSGIVNMTMTATTLAFDAAITSPTGDLWQTGLNPALAAKFSPVVVQPGESATINVTVTPSGTPGTTVSGTLYVGSFVSALPPSGQVTGSDLAAIPYAYTIK